MPSFDIVSQVDLQRVDDAVNNTKRQLLQRYDFRGSNTEITFDRKQKVIHVQTADKMKMDALREVFLANVVRQKLSGKAFAFGEPEPTSAGALKREITIREGIERELAKEIIKQIKDTKLKVQPSVQGDELRVTGKKLDDLQAVMALVREQDFEVDLQFINMRS